jgi:O-antigen/teichoic acid export membrane protein
MAWAFSRPTRVRSRQPAGRHSGQDLAGRAAEPAPGAGRGRAGPGEPGPGRAQLKPGQAGEHARPQPGHPGPARAGPGQAGPGGAGRDGSRVGSGLAGIAKGSTLNLAGAAISAIATLGVTLVVTRKFSPQVAGAFFSATSLFLIIEAVASLGAYTGLVYFIARLRSLDGQNRIPAILRAAVIPVVVASVLAAALLLLLAGPLAHVLLDGHLGQNGARPGAVATALRALALALPFATLLDTFLGASRGYRDMHPTVMVDRIGRSVIQCVAVAAAALAGSTALLAPLWALPYLPAAAIAWLWFRRIRRRKPPRPRRTFSVPVGPSAFRPAGPSAAGAGTAGPSAAGAGAAGPSVTGASTAGYSAAGPGASGGDGFVSDMTLPLPIPVWDPPPRPASARPAGAAAGRAPERKTGDQRLANATPRGFWLFTVPRGLATLAQVTIQRIDIVLVAIMRGPKEAAIYTAATRFLVVGQLGSTALSMAAQPRFTELFAVGDRRRANLVYQATTAWLVLLTWPLYLLALIYGPQLLLVFGHAYRTGALVIVVLSLSMLLSAACGQVDMVLNTTGRSSWSLANGLMAVSINVGLDLFLIPRYGILGAAIGWAAAIAIANLVPLVQVAVVVRLHPFGRGTFIACVLSTLSFAVIPLAVRSLAGPGEIAAAAAVAAGCAALAAGLWRFRDTLRLTVMPGLSFIARKARNRAAGRQ